MFSFDRFVSLNKNSPCSKSEFVDLAAAAIRVSRLLLSVWIDEEEELVKRSMSRRRCASYSRCRSEKDALKLLIYIFF